MDKVVLAVMSLFHCSVGWRIRCRSVPLQVSAISVVVLCPVAGLASRSIVTSAVRVWLTTDLVKVKALSVLFRCERTKRVGLQPWRWTNERGASGDAGGEKKGVLLAKPAERERNKRTQLVVL